MGFSQNKLMELASEENKARANLVKERFISNFEKQYGYDVDVTAEFTDMPPFYVAAMPSFIQEEIREKVIARLTELGECTPKNVNNAMNSKLYDLANLIDIYECVIQAEERQRKTEEGKREKR